MSAYICVRMVDMLFLSSRRRHTRFALVTGVQTVLFRSGDAAAADREVDPGAVRGDGDREGATGGAVGLRSECDGVVAVGEDQQLIAAAVVGDCLPESGRASGRERERQYVYISVGDVLITTQQLYIHITTTSTPNRS